MLQIFPSQLFQHYYFTSVICPHALNSFIVLSSRLFEYLELKKAFSPDGISVRMLKETAISVTPVSARLFNQSIVILMMFQKICKGLPVECVSKHGTVNTQNAELSKPKIVSNLAVFGRLLNILYSSLPLFYSHEFHYAIFMVIHFSILALTRQNCSVIKLLSLIYDDASCNSLNTFNHAVQIHFAWLLVCTLLIV